MMSFIIDRRAQHFTEIHLNADRNHWDVLITYKSNKASQERNKEIKKEIQNISKQSKPKFRHGRKQRFSEIMS